jgi:hypothetical protein
MATQLLVIQPQNPGGKPREEIGRLITAFAAVWLLSSTQISVRHTVFTHAARLVFYKRNYIL